MSWRRTVYVELADKYKSNVESDHGDDILHFHAYISDFNFWLLLVFLQSLK